MGSLHTRSGASCRRKSAAASLPSPAVGRQQFIKIPFSIQKAFWRSTFRGSGTTRPGDERTSPLERRLWQLQHLHPYAGCDCRRLRWRVTAQCAAEIPVTSTNTWARSSIPMSGAVYDTFCERLEQGFYWKVVSYVN